MGRGRPRHMAPDKEASEVKRCQREVRYFFGSGGVVMVAHITGSKVSEVSGQKQSAKHPILWRLASAGPRSYLVKFGWNRHKGILITLHDHGDLFVCWAACVLLHGSRGSM
jgi:hypothetical protein